METFVQLLLPILAFLSVPIVLWPSIVMVIALIKQAGGAMLLKPKHIAIFIAIQIIWIILVFIVSASLLKPFQIRF